jgi:hypothetical protein
MVSLPMEAVAVDALEARYGASLRSQGFDHACLVMRGGAGAGTAQPAGFWSRFVMVEGVGVWAMELMHSATGYWDLYITDPNLREFDNMACNCGTHPSAFTKRSLQWLDRSAIATTNGRRQTYDLHSVGLVQPPPTGRHAAVQVGAGEPYLIAESRARVDQFDTGIPSEGVIVYEVVSEDAHGDPALTMPLIYLKTPVALAPGGRFTSDSGVTVRVVGAIPGGHTIEVDRLTLEPLWAAANMGQGSGAMAWLHGDVNGDGRDEIVQPWSNNGRLGMLVYGWSGTALQTLFTSADLGHGAAALAWLVGDVNRDGRAEIIQPWSNNGRAGLIVYAWSDAGMTPVWRRTTPATNPIQWHGSLETSTATVRTKWCSCGAAAPAVWRWLSTGGPATE